MKTNLFDYGVTVSACGWETYDSIEEPNRIDSAAEDSFILKFNQTVHRDFSIIEKYYVGGIKLEAFKPSWALWYHYINYVDSNGQIDFSYHSPFDGRRFYDTNELKKIVRRMLNNDGYNLNHWKQS